MLVKKFTYKNYYGEEVTEEARFNLTKTEVLNMELGTYGGISALLKKIVDAKDAPEIMKWYGEFIRLTYGVISADGRRFIKSAELSEEFAQTPMYDQLFLELTTGGDLTAAAFVEGVMPDDLKNNPNYQEAIAKLAAGDADDSEFQE